MTTTQPAREPSAQPNPLDTEPRGFVRRLFAVLRGHQPAVELRWWQASALSLIAGVLLGLAFVPYGLWFTAPFGIALVCWLSRQLRLRRVIWCGFLSGLVMNAMTVSYVYVVGWWMPLLLVPVLALWVSLTAVVQHYGQSLRAWPIWAASGWTLAEALAQRFPMGGFAWDRLAFTTPDSPFGGYLWVTGAAGTGWIVALVGCLIVAACDALRSRPARIRSAIGWLVAIAIVTAAGAGLGAIPVEDPDQGDVTIGVVQGNVDGTAGPRAMGYARSVTYNHMSETIMAAARARTGLDPQPDFYVWPENSTDIDPNTDAQTRRLIDTAQAIPGVPILVGAITDGPGDDERQTTGIWWTSEGETDRYSKRNAVPFGEYTPMKELVFALVPMAQQVGRQTVPGDGPGVVTGTLNDGSSLSVGDIICYELAFDSTVYDVEKAGAQVVTVQSNNATYTGTMQPRQQFQITRVRAMEMRREIVVSTTSSLSGLIDARGGVVAQSHEATAYAQSFTVPLRSGVTPGLRIGPVVELLAGLAGVLVCALAIADSRLSGRGRSHKPSSGLD